MTNHIILWLVLIGVPVVCAWWYIRENKRMAIEWEAQLGSDAAAWVSRFIWSRTLQTILILIGCVTIIAAYDWQLSEIRNGTSPGQPMTNYDPPKDGPVLMMDGGQPVSVNDAPPAQPAAEAAPQQPAASAQAVPTNDYPPQVPDDSGDTEEALEQEPATVNDVYNPEQTGGDNQSAMDAIKKRYEDIFVTYMFLKKCRMVNANDYHIINSALGQEIASINAPGRLQYDIFTSAQGSFKEMYAKTPCDRDPKNPLYVQYEAYIKALSANQEAPTQ